MNEVLNGNQSRSNQPITECKMMSGPTTSELSLPKVLYALSDPNRLRIIGMIVEAGGELKCGSFAERIGVSKPTLSHHFGILRDAGVIATRLEGTQKLNQLRTLDLESRFPGLLRAVLDSFLSDLKLLV